MVMLVIGSIIIGLSTVGVAIGIGRMLADFTPGRRTRGIARWWGRCTRWVHRLRNEPRRTMQSTLKDLDAMDLD